MYNIPIISLEVYNSMSFKQKRNLPAYKNCPCGSLIASSNFKEHLSSIKHLEFLKNHL